jgi:1,4-alpha-glucan branching enzyme
MEEQGYLLLVLNTHMPFIRHPEHAYREEENWLFEAITECYLPLIRVFQGLIRDGVNFKVTISLTPCLVAMLADPLVQQRYLRYLDDRIALTEKEMARLSGNPEFFRLARRYHDERFKCRELFVEKWNQNLVSAFKYVLESGQVELITSAATHAYLPLWEIYPQAVDFQIRVGIQQFQNYFGHKPSGFWLPECGYYPGVDVLLQQAGIKYFFLETHGITNGHPRPKFDIHAPIHCPSGVAAFGRNWFLHNLMWGKDSGYPGDSFYLNFDRDIGYDLEFDYLYPFTHQAHRIPTGIKYFRNRWMDGSDLYNPDIAFVRCDEHANDFVFKCQRQVEHLYSGLGRKPVLVALVDTEHFGHWWGEGPTWLDLVIRKLAHDQQTIKLITAVDYLRMYPTNQIVAPSTSSWGYQGYSEVWLIGNNHWIYPPVFEAIELLPELVQMKHVPRFKTAVNQYLRELLLAQTSDWAYILHTGTDPQYAEQRVTEHIGNMMSIYRQVRQGSIDREWLAALEDKNNIFADIDLSSIYSKAV